MIQAGTCAMEWLLMDSIFNRYQNDLAFNRLVTNIEAMILNAEFTGSEIRQAAMMACINVESRKLRSYTVIPREAEEALQVLGKTINDIERNHEDDY